jgi:Flp pilus assembly pilin Flp
MDKLRVAATGVVTGVTRARPLRVLRAAWTRMSTDQEPERGQGLAEYALILAGIAIVAIASLVFLGGVISDLFWAPIDEEFGRIVSEVLGIG